MAAVTGQGDVTLTEGPPAQSLVVQAGDQTRIFHNDFTAGRQGSLSPQRRAGLKPPRPFPVRSWPLVRPGPRFDQRHLAQRAPHLPVPAAEKGRQGQDRTHHRGRSVGLTTPRREGRGFPGSRKRRVHPGEEQPPVAVPEPGPRVLRGLAIAGLEPRVPGAPGEEAGVRDLLVPDRLQSGLDALATAAALTALSTVTVTGTGEAAGELWVPYRGERLSGSALLRRWRRGQPTRHRNVVRGSRPNGRGLPEWLALPGRTVVVLGAGAERGHCRSCCSASAKAGQLRAVDEAGGQAAARRQFTRRLGVPSSRSA